MLWVFIKRGNSNEYLHVLYGDLSEKHFCFFFLNCIFTITTLVCLAGANQQNYVYAQQRLWLSCTFAPSDDFARGSMGAQGSKAFSCRQSRIRLHQCAVWVVHCSHTSFYEPPHDKTNNMAVRPVKTRMNLGICPVWSESSLSAWRKLGSLATHRAHSEDSDQTGRTVILLVLSSGSSYELPCAASLNQVFDDN